jgi:hypothetical protein
MTSTGRSAPVANASSRPIGDAGAGPFRPFKKGKPDVRKASGNESNAHLDLEILSMLNGSVTGLSSTPGVLTVELVQQGRGGRQDNSMGPPFDLLFQEKHSALRVTAMGKIFAPRRLASLGRRLSDG